MRQCFNLSALMMTAAVFGHIFMLVKLSIFWRHFAPMHKISIPKPSFRWWFM